MLNQNRFESSRSLISPSPLNSSQVWHFDLCVALGSSSLTSWTTRWTWSETSGGASTGPVCSSAGDQSRPQVWNINQNAILDRHSMVMVPGLWNFFPCQDALEVRTSSTTPGDEKKQSDPLALIFIHILTYLEEELAWRHWERLLRATSIWAIFTVLLFKKVLIKTSLHCVPPMTQGPQIFTTDSYHNAN